MVVAPAAPATVPRSECLPDMKIDRLFRVLVLAGSALGLVACAGANASGSGAGQSSQQQDPSKGSTAPTTPPPSPPMRSGGGGPSGW